MEISRDLHYIECMLEQIASYDINYKNSTRNKYRAIQAHESCRRTNVSIDTDFAKKKKKQMPRTSKCLSELQSTKQNTLLFTCIGIARALV